VRAFALPVADTATRLPVDQNRSGVNPRMDYRPDAPCPLDGVRVLDLSRLVAGNMLSHVLADHGAEVIKIEDPKTGDALRDWKVGGVSAHWKVYARNKKSVTLNLREAEGRAILLRLVDDSDVLIENFRVGAMERMGLGPEVLHARNPKLVMVRVTGWGQTGPYAERPGFGTLIEAMSGFAAKTGFPDSPPALPNMALADTVAGLYGAFAVMVALREREVKNGPGQVVDLSLLEPLFSILGADVAVHAITGKAPGRSGNRSNTAAPRNIYRTREGNWVAISGSMQAMAMRLFRAIGRPDMCDDPKFATNSARLANVEELDAVIQADIETRTLAENLEFFARAEVTAGPVYDAGQIKEDPHVQGREVVVNLPDDEIGSLPMHNIIPRLSATPGAIRTPAPSLGQHNEEIYGAIGLDAPARARLSADGII